MKRNDPRCGSTCTRVAGSDWANWCRMLIICAAIEIARRGHSTTALSMGTYILARRSRYLFCGVCRSSLNFRALRPSTFIWCSPLGLGRFHVVARMWPLHIPQYYRWLTCYVCAILCQYFGQGCCYFRCDKPCRPSCNYTCTQRCLLLRSCVYLNSLGKFGFQV